jgi:competence protein ComEA
MDRTPAPDPFDRLSRRVGGWVARAERQQASREVEVVPAAPPVGPGPVDGWPGGPGPGRHRRPESLAPPAALEDDVTVEPAPAGGGWRLTGLPAWLVLATVVVAALLVWTLLSRPDGSGTVALAPGGGPGAAAGSGVGTPPAATAGALPASSAGPVGDGPAADPVADAAGPSVAPAPPGGAVPPTSVQGPEAGSPDVLVVHVDGAVAAPGVVRLRPGDRVADAVEAAGGVLDGADTRLVNLARTVVDGELVVVPREGEEALLPPPPAGSGGGDPPGAAAGSTGPPGAGVADGTELVDLNTADVVQLDTLPGIGPVLAERVVAWREEVGPFGSVEELTSVSGIGPAVLDRLRDLVTV